MEGSRLSRKVQSRKCRANRRGDQRIKLVVWHAPATLRPEEPPGAGGLTTPKGGAPPAPHLVQCPSELLTSFGCVLVGISITLYAVFVLVLCLVCGRVVLGLCWGCGACSSGVALCWVCYAVSAAPCLPVQCPREL